MWIGLMGLPYLHVQERFRCLEACSRLFWRTQTSCLPLPMAALSAVADVGGTEGSGAAKGRQNAPPLEAALNAGVPLPPSLPMNFCHE